MNCSTQWFWNFCLVSFFTWNVFGSIAPITVKTCGGGDGPIPLSDLSGFFPKASEEVITHGFVKEFVYWPNKDVIIYRNSDHHLYRKSLSSGENTYLSAMFTPLSRIVDEEEKFVLSSTRAAFLNSEKVGMGWRYFPTKFPITEHLFWKKDAQDDILYSLANVMNKESNSQTFIVYSYRNGDMTPSECRLSMNPGERFFIGKGHEFPTVFLYKTRGDGEGTEIQFYEIDLEKVIPDTTCKLKMVHRPTWVRGKVHSVHRFSDYRSFAIRIDNEAKGLVWLKQGASLKKCLYYDFQGREPLVLNPKQPILATWGAGEGIKLVLPNLKAEGKVFPGLGQYAPTEKSFWLSDNGKKIFFATPRGRLGKKIYYSKIPD